MISSLPNEILEIIVNKLQSTDRQQLQKVLKHYWITEKEDRIIHKFRTILLEEQIQHIHTVWNRKYFDFETIHMISGDRILKDNHIIKFKSIIIPTKDNNKIKFLNDMEYSILEYIDSDDTFYDGCIDIPGYLNFIYRSHIDLLNI